LDLLALHQHTSRSNREIAHDLTISHHAINYILARFQDSDLTTTGRIGACGRKRKLDKRGILLCIIQGMKKVIPNLARLTIVNIYLKKMMSITYVCR
jgi:transposase